MAGPASLFREIHRLRRFSEDAQKQLEEIPRRRKVFQGKLAKAELALKEEQETIKKLKVTAAEREKSLKSAHDQLTRHEQQFETVTNKKEYDALQLEIAGGKEKCARLEDEAFAALSEGEERTANLPALQKVIDTARQDLAKFEADVAPRRAMLESEQKQALVQLAEQEKLVPPDLRDQYNRTIRSQGADGFALVKDHVCTACNTELIRQMEADLMRDLFVMCKSCHRILYMPATKPTLEDDKPEYDE